MHSLDSVQPVMRSNSDPNSVAYQSLGRDWAELCLADGVLYRAGWAGRSELGGESP